MTHHPPPPDDWEDFDDLSEVTRHALEVAHPLQRRLLAKLARGQQRRDSVPPPMPRWLWHMVAGLLLLLIAGGGSLAGATYLQARDTARVVAEELPRADAAREKVREGAEAALARHEDYGHRDVARALQALDRRLGSIEARLDERDRRRPGGR